METEEKQSENKKMLNKLKSQFQVLDAKLDAIDQQIDGRPENNAESMKAEHISDEAIRDDIAAYKKAIDDLKETRINIYRYSNQKNQEAAFYGLDEIRRMVELLKEMKDNSEELIRQCDYLKKTKDSLQEIGNNEQLFQLMDTLRERMIDLGGCDEKIKVAAETAMQRVSTMEEVLDKRLTDTKSMEAELLDSSKALRQTADNIDTIIKAASNGSIQNIQDALVQIQQNIQSQVHSMDQSVQGLLAVTKEKSSSADASAQNIESFNETYKELKEARIELRQIQTVLADKTFLDKFDRIRKSNELQRLFMMLQRKLDDDELEDARQIVNLLVQTCNLGHTIYKNIANIVKK